MAGSLISCGQASSRSGSRESGCLLIFSKSPLLINYSVGERRRPEPGAASTNSSSATWMTSLKIHRILFPWLEMT